MKPDKEEEPWTSNLQGVQPPARPDELELLRAEMTKREKEKEEEENKRSKSRRKSKKDKKGKEKEKKEDRKEPGKEATAKAKKAHGKEESDVSSEQVALDGSQPRRAAQKTRAALFAGTGMGPVEKVRARVARSARKIARKRGKKRSSSSRSSRSSSSDGGVQDFDDGIFAEATRIRGVADACPGALAHRALSAMQEQLLQGIGLETTRGPRAGVAVQYYRQVMQGKISGAPGREALTLAASIDLVSRGRACQALDLMIQRYKSLESTAGGSHWQVSQMELLPSDKASIAEITEVKDARKEVTDETKLTWMASSVDGKGYGNKTGAKGKAGSKEDGKRWQDRGKGKGSNPNKGDKWKKEETPKSG